jgi:Mg/Co/Ni transporter MgtE
MDIDVEKTFIEELIQRRDKEQLELKLESWLPEELAMLCQDLNTHEQVFVFNVIDREQAYQTFELLDLNAQVLLLDVLRNRQVQLILNDMSADNRTAF